MQPQNSPQVNNNRLVDVLSKSAQLIACYRNNNARSGYAFRDPPQTTDTLKLLNDLIDDLTVAPTK
jgi:hypothetical protein